MLLLDKLTAPFGMASRKPTLLPRASYPSSLNLEFSNRASIALFSIAIHIIATNQPTAGGNHGDEFRPN